MKMNNRKLLYLDTDLGLGTPGAELDDAAALITLCQSSAVQLIAAGSTYGNVPLNDATINLSRASSMLSIKIQLGRGVNQPLKSDMHWFEDWQQGYGKTLEWSDSDVVQNASDLLIKCVKANPHQVTLLAIGPLTNLAVAIEKAPEIIPLVKEVIVMGGSFGAQVSSPEFNMRCDPEAAALVLSADWPVVMLGLNITRQVHFSREELNSLSDWNPFISLLKEQSPAWIDRVESMGWDKGGCALHDAVAAVYAIDPSLFTITATGVDVEMIDPGSRGLTRFAKVGDSESKKMVITDLDMRRVHQQIINSLNHQEAV